MIQIDARNITWDLGRDITYEVLIENLGGYESAKYKLRDNGSLHAERLKKALLEYRRQHNIFEIGDSVLPISNYSDQVHFLADWYIENLDFRYTTNSGSWGIIVKSLMDGAWRHATDEEIKAGKRLEVNQ